MTIENKTKKYYKWIIIIVVMIVLSLFLAFPVKRSFIKFAEKYVQDKVTAIEKQYDQKIQDYETRIKTLEGRTNSLEFKYNKTLTALKIAAQKEKEIKKPVSDDEITKGLERHGLKPVVRND